MRKAARKVVLGRTAKRLFKSDFEESITFTPTYYSGFSEVDLSSGANAFGHSWPMPAELSARTYIYCSGRTVGPSSETLSGVNFGDYFTLETITPPGDVGPSAGHAGGASKKMMHIKVKRPGGEPQYLTNDSEGDSQQASFWFHPKAPYNYGKLLYQRMYLFLPSDLFTRQLQNAQHADGSWANWQAIFEYKTGALPENTGTGGDFRLLATIADEAANKWKVTADEVANGVQSNIPGGRYTISDLSGVAPPAGAWFKFEVLSKHGASGFAKMAVDGKLIIDTAGRVTAGNLNSPINRWFVFNTYSGGHMPIDLWCDEFELWADGMPSDASSVLR